MDAKKSEYKKLLQDSLRYKYVKYEMLPEQWLTLSNVESVEEVDEMIDQWIEEMWDRNKPE